MTACHQSTIVADINPIVIMYDSNIMTAVLLIGNSVNCGSLCCSC